MLYVSRFICYLLLLFMFLPVLNAQKQITREEYIQRFSDISVKEMKRSGIPASITLAQGVLESGSGNSRLAREANNHFGIKCHDWTGPSIRHDDDAPGECFRKYKSAEESYRDHSDFLMTRARYAFLFDYKSDDYKNWAHGLKKAGYATNPRYANLLIDIIENNELYRYDNTKINTAKSNRTKPSMSVSSGIVVPKAGDEDFLRRLSNSGIREINGVPFMFAQEGDNFKMLKKETSIGAGRLARWNELDKRSILYNGQIVFLGAKKNSAAFKTHTVVSGESWYSISQRYGIKTDKLLRKNKNVSGAPVREGQVVRLK